MDRWKKSILAEIILFFILDNNKNSEFSNHIKKECLLCKLIN